MTAHVVRPSLFVKKDGSNIGYADVLDFIGSNVSASSLGRTVTLTVTGGGSGPSGSIATNVVPTWNEVPSGTIDGINMVFTLAYQPVSAASVMLFLNGRLTREGVSNDYVLSGSAVSMMTAPMADDVLLASYLRAGTSYSWNEVPSGSVDSVNRDFYLAHEPVNGSLMLFFNGIMIRGAGNDYSLTGSHVVLEPGFKTISGDILMSSYEYVV